MWKIVCFLSLVVLGKTPLQNAGVSKGEKKWGKELTIPSPNACEDTLVARGFLVNPLVSDLGPLELHLHLGWRGGQWSESQAIVKSRRKIDTARASSKWSKNLPQMAGRKNEILTMSYRVWLSSGMALELTFFSYTCVTLRRNGRRKNTMKYGR